MKSTYTIRRQGDTVVVAVRGELAEKIVETLQAELKEILHDPASQTVALELANVCFMNTMGINLLVVMNKLAEKLDKRFIVLRPGESVRKVLQLVQLHDYLYIRDAL